jgi:LPXTG-motif cell wall-anchored protein
MADTATAAPSGKFSLSKPNAKTYLIVGGIAIVGGALYLWWRKKQAAAAAAATGSTTGSGNTIYYPSPTGLSASQLLAWISDHQSSPAPATSTSTGTQTGTTPNQPRPTSITAGGHDTEDINNIARQYGLTEQALIKANPGLRKLKVKVGNKSVPLIGSGAPVPAGTKINIPAA